MTEYIYKRESIGDGVYSAESTGEQIVRCRDCKFCMAYMAGTYCDYMAHAINLDGYCAWGEPRKAVEHD